MGRVKFLDPLGRWFGLPREGRKVHPAKCTLSVLAGKHVAKLTTLQIVTILVFNAATNLVLQ